MFVLFFAGKKKGKKGKKGKKKKGKKGKKGKKEVCGSSSRTSPFLSSCIQKKEKDLSEGRTIHSIMEELIHETILHKVPQSQYNVTLRVLQALMCC